MRALLVVLAALFALPAAGDEWRIMEAREVSIEWYRLANNRDAYFPYADMGEDGEFWDYGTAVKYDLDLLRYGDYGLHWSNDVRGNSTNVQFRSVAWEFRWGLYIGPNLELFYDHVSEHILDTEPATGGRSYKLHNAYGAEWIFYRRAEK